MNSLIPFSQNDIDSIYNFLVKFSESKTTKTNSLEYEIRFGEFYIANTDQSSNNPKNSFNSSISVDAFYRLKSKLTQNSFNAIKTEEINTTESIYNNKQFPVKKVISKDNSYYFLSKKSIEKYDIYEYNLRLALSSEEILQKQKTEAMIINSNPALIRNKKRFSYFFKDFKIDFTEVSNTIDKTPSSFELELEILQSDTELSKKFEILMTYINVISNILIDNYYVIPVSLIKNTIKGYMNMTKKNYFVGAQPITLHKENLKQLYTVDYAVTEKLDGDRYFLYSDSKKECFLLSSNLKVKKTMFSCNIANSLLDGELIVNGNMFEYHIFDILFHDNKDIQNNIDYNLHKRLDLCNSFVFESAETSVNFFKFIVKSYIFKNVFLGSEIILNNSIHKNDGLIFVPIQEPYITKTSTFKWKPANLNSIDFYSVKIGDSNKWDLYVQHSVKGQNTQPKKVLFDTNNKALNCFNLKHTLNSNSPLESFQTIILENKIDPITNMPYKNNTVIEFTWDFKQEMFVPIRTRWDKTLNPKKHGNFSTVACDIWKNIHNPITTDLLFKTTVRSNNGKDIYFYNMRKFHNSVKKYLYEKYTKNNKFLLELSSGQGGDLFKWISNNISTVKGYDISKKNIEECKKRVSEQKSTYDYKFYQQDLSDVLSANIIKSHLPYNSYDTVSCQFAIHYYFSDLENINNIIRILDTNLKQDGIFMITFMDNKKIVEIMDDKNINYYIHPETKDIVYYLKTSSVNSPFNNKLKIILNGNNILTEGSREFIVDTDFLLSHFSDNGYSLLESSLFQDGKNTIDPSNYDLSVHEKNISFLNRFCVFKKNKPVILFTPAITLPELIPQISCKTIDLNNIPELSVYKIENATDIISLLKCIWIGDSSFSNLSIASNLNFSESSFQDIESIVNSINSSQSKFVFEPVLLNTVSKNSSIVKTPIITIPILQYTYKDPDSVNKRMSVSEQVFYTNWYIVLYKNNLSMDSSSILNILNDYNVDIKQRVFLPSIVEELPIPANEIVEELPIPANEIVEELPIPANEIVEDQPIPANEIVEELPIPANEIVEDQPILANEIVEELPILANEIVEDQPIPANEIVEDQPIPANEIVEDQPIPTNEIVEDQPIPANEIVEDPPIPANEIVEELPIPANEIVEDPELIINDTKKDIIKKKQDILQEIKNKNNKITVAEIKIYLKSLNESTTGLKAELLKRLIESLKKQ
jgi:2-polyprenyl-3-methyl-5-hydroxy-6-metoxy-1,4-benzoquinol methylase